MLRVHSNQVVEKVLHYLPIVNILLVLVLLVLVFLPKSASKSSTSENATVSTAGGMTHLITTDSSGNMATLSLDYINSQFAAQTAAIAAAGTAATTYYNNLNKSISDNNTTLTAALGTKADDGASFVIATSAGGQRVLNNDGTSVNGTLNAAAPGITESTTTMPTTGLFDGATWTVKAANQGTAAQSQKGFSCGWNYKNSTTCANTGSC